MIALSPLDSLSERRRCMGNPLSSGASGVSGGTGTQREEMVRIAPEYPPLPLAQPPHPTSLESCPTSSYMDRNTVITRKLTSFHN